MMNFTTMGRLIDVLPALCLSFFLLQGAWAVEPGQPAPAFDIHLIDGAVQTNQSDAGKVVVLHFWASWCQPCRAEMEAIQGYYAKHHREGLEFIAISMDDPEDMGRVKTMIGRYAFQNAWIRDANVREFGRIWRIPLSFVIDRHGILRLDAWDGGAAGIDETSLESAVTPLLVER